VQWSPTVGDWTVVVLNADATPGVAVTVSVAATLPALGWIAACMLVAGALALAAGIALVAVPVAGAARSGAMVR
jgi:hypothetical protein